MDKLSPNENAAGLTFNKYPEKRGRELISLKGGRGLPVHCSNKYITMVCAFFLANQLLHSSPYHLGGRCSKQRRKYLGFCCLLGRAQVRVICNSLWVVNMRHGPWRRRRGYAPTHARIYLLLLQIWKPRTNCSLMFPLSQMVFHFLPSLGRFQRGGGEARHVS